MKNLFLISLLLHILLISHAQIDSVVVDHAEIDTVFINVHISHHMGNLYFTDSTTYVTVGDTAKIQFYQTESCELVTCDLCPEIRKVKIPTGVYKYAVFNLFTKDAILVELPDSCVFTEYYFLSGYTLNLSHANDVDLYNNPSLLIYPNPASNELVVYNTTNRSKPIQVFNMNGNTLISKVILGIETIDVSHLPAGEYIAISNNQPSVKFIIKH